MSLNQIIFIPGFYGTKLAEEESGDVVWLTAGQSFFGSQTVAMTGLGVPGAIPLVPTTVLDRVKILFGIFSIDVYGGIIDFLKKDFKGTAQVHVLAYDWRKDYFEAVRLLDAKVKTLKEAGAGSISIVSHSMGGLVTSYYLRYGSQEPETATEDWSGAKQIKKVVMAGVPFRGSIISFRNMKWGVKWGANKDLTKAHALCSFQTNYQLLPLRNDKILDENLETTDLEVLNAENWRSYEWGFLKNTTGASDGMMKKRVEFVYDSIARSKSLSGRINEDYSNNAALDAELLYFYSASNITLEKAVFLTDEKILLFDEDEFRKYYPDKDYGLLSGDGDGTVTKRSSRLPDAYSKSFSKVTVKEITAEHTKMYADKGVRQEIRKFLGD